MSVASAIGKRTGLLVASKLLVDVAERLAGGTRAAIDEVVKRRGPAIAADADVFRSLHRDLQGRDLFKALIRERERAAAAAGLVTGLPSLVPGAGTVVEVAAGIADADAGTYAQVSLTQAIAHLSGRDVSDVEARRLDVILVLGIASDVVKRDGPDLKANGHTISLADLERQGIPDDVIGKLNRAIGERIIVRIAERRARVLTRRLLPLGIGLGVAIVADYRAVRSAGKAALQYLDWLDSARPR